MDTSTFFAKKRQELQKNNPQPQYRTDVPWWQDPEYTKSKKDEPTQPMETVADSNRDFSRADHLRSKSGSCPHCGSNSFMKPSASGAARCFDCGYIDGRQVNDLNTLAITADVKTVHVKQTADGGAQKYRARIGKSASDINRANAELEQSFIGKAHVDS